MKKPTFILDTPTVIQKSVTIKTIPLPTEYTGYVAIPRSLRAYVFTCTKTREVILHKRLSYLGDTEILFSGQELNQSDLDAFLAVKHLAHSDFPNTTTIKTSKILRLLDRTDGLNSRKKLIDQLRSLRFAFIEIKNDKRGEYFSGNLISELRASEDYCSVEVGLNNTLHRLFEKNWQYVSLETRNGLKTSLSKWLYCFVCGQQEIYPTSVMRFKELSGSKASYKTYRRALKTALTELKSVGLIRDFEFDEEIVKIDLKPLKSLKSQPKKL